MSEIGVTSSSTHWQKISLSDVFSVSSGEGLSQTQMRPGNHPVYGGNGITGFHDTFLFEASRLIIGRVGEYCGNVYITRQKSWVTDNALIATFHDEAAYLPFWFYYLNHLGLNDFAFAAAQPVITGGIFERISGCVPPLPQQRKIARILTTLDNVITQTEALIAKYQAIKQGLMHDLFTRGVDATGKLRPPQSEAPELYKQSELGWIPKEWEVHELGAVCTWMSGGTPSKSNPEFWTGEIPWVSPKDMKKFEIGDSEDHISDDAARIGTRFVPAGTVLIVIRGMILAHSFPVCLTTRPVTFNQDIKALVFNGTVEGRFLAYWLVSKASAMIALATESTHGTKRYDMDDLQSVPFGIPCEFEQQTIVSRLDSLANCTRNEQEQLKKLQIVKTGLMQDLLTGKVPVKADEPEEITPA